MKKIVFAIIALLISGNIIAQNGSLPQGDVLIPEGLGKQIITKVTEFTDQLQPIADKNRTNAERMENVGVAKSFFYGLCDSCSWNGTRSIAKMQVSSAQGRPTRTFPMKNYLTNLANLKYSNVIIKQVGKIVIEGNKMKKVGDHYEATVSWAQVFIGGSVEKPVYVDLTKKTTIVRINTTPKGQYIIDLWDTQCHSTEKLTGADALDLIDLN